MLRLVEQRRCHWKLVLCGRNIGPASDVSLYLAGSFVNQIRILYFIRQFDEDEL